MIKDYLELAVRNLNRRIVFTFINIPYHSVVSSTSFLILPYAIIEYVFSKHRANGSLYNISKLNRVELISNEQGKIKVTS